MVSVPRAAVSPLGGPSSLHHRPYIQGTLWRSSRGRPVNAPAAFIHPCQPVVAKQPPAGPGWAHELKHDGYRLQIHVRDGRVRLYTMNGADWSKRYPLIIEAGARLKGPAIFDAEVVWLDAEGVADFEALHSCLWPTETICGAGHMSNGRRRCANCYGVVTAFSMLNTPKVTAINSLTLLASWGLRGLCRRNSMRPKVKNPKAPAATRAQDGTF